MLDREAEDVTGTRLGYDIESHDATGLRLIKVVMDRGQDAIDLSRNAALACLDSGLAYQVAMVGVDSRNVRWLRPQFAAGAPFKTGIVHAVLYSVGD